MSFRQKPTVSLTHVVPGNRQRLWKTSVGRAAAIQSTTDIFDSIATSIVSAQSNALSDSPVAANNGTSDSGMSKE
jgi:hypothetical protein